MKRSELKSLVAEELESDPESLSEDTPLSSIEAFDSASVLYLMMALEEKAGIKLAPEDIGKLNVYGDIEKLAREQGVELIDD